ncbi:dysbindin-like [Ochotona curzoniae]|uniref:dysbindin-like n=1 Tax=Ochotona curzoniae TaxID=130825 RepID=UPI001B34BE5C|nr:dysbindin-like [Ochotona curzoniae]
MKLMTAELDAEHSQRVQDMEHAQQARLKERQKFFEEAFQQDVEQYLSTGHLHITGHREPMGSMSSMEVNVDMLEHMDLMDISDQEALDVFLNSGGEEGSVQSPVTGPEPQTCITFEVPHPSHLPTEPPSSPYTCSNSAAQDAGEGSARPMVQSDEEDVQVDTALATLHSDGKAATEASDDSDS